MLSYTQKLALRNMESEDADAEFMIESRNEANHPEDVDMEICQICGGYYSHHSKEKEFARQFPGQIVMQRCFTCWDL